MFLVKFQDKNENELLSWNEMQEHFPRQAMNYFKGRIHWSADDAVLSDAD